MVEGEAREELERLREKLSVYEKQMGKLRYPIPSSDVADHTPYYKGRDLKIAFVSDTHLGSRYERLNDLDKAYEIIQKEGAQAVYHCGDMVDGSSNMHKGFEHELRVHGFEEQVGHVIKQYPKLDNIPTYWIEGNHDYSFTKDNGASVSKHIYAARPDLMPIGEVEADIRLARNVVLRLRHGMAGSGSYAKSYKIQRYIDSLDGGTKPNILASGHYHRDMFMSHRNIMALEVPCLQSQSNYLKQLGLAPSMGFWLADIHISPDGSVNRFKPELIKFYEKRVFAK